MINILLKKNERPKTKLITANFYDEKKKAKNAFGLNH